MIISFSIENYRSFAREETLSLVSSSRITGHEEHLLSIPGSDEKLLRCSLLYGANGAGKSNLVRALNFLQKSILRTEQRPEIGTGRDAFQFHPEWQSIPTTLDLQFIAEGESYRYGLKFDDSVVLEEWLSQGANERLLYERKTDSEGDVSLSAPGFHGHKKLEAMATVGGPANVAFLATIHTNLKPEDCGREIGAVLRWFKDQLRIIRPESAYTRLMTDLVSDRDFREFVSHYLKEASTGIDHLEVETTQFTREELEKIIPSKILSAFTKETSPDVRPILLNHEKGLVIEEAGPDLYSVQQTQSVHEHFEGHSVALDLDEESDGTRRLIQLLPALHQLKKGPGVYVIDEIDRSMHPILTYEFLNYFLNKLAGSGQQLIVTTHESHLLDLDLLRRDEIWFVEKDLHGASRLYSLSDFKIRKDLEIRKHYFQGRFGAVPFTGNLHRMIVEEV